MLLPIRQLSLLALGLVLVLALLATAKANRLGLETTIANNPAEPYQELAASLSDLQTEKTLLEDQVALLRRQLKTAEADALVARSELQKLHTLEDAVGLATRKGPGVIITLDDRPGGSASADLPEEICHAANLRDIINLLRLAGATAISINDQRVLVSTTTTCIDNGVLINGNRLLAPYFIKAIGDTDILRNYLATKRYLPTIHQRKEKGALKFEVLPSPELVLPEFKGQLTTQETRLRTSQP